MVNNIFKNIDEFNNKHKKIFIFLLFMPYVYHISLPSGDIAILEYINCRLIILSFLFLLFYYFVIKRKKPSLLLIATVACTVWMFITTKINNPDKSYKMVLYVCSSIGIVLLVESFIDSIEDLIKSAMLCFEIQIYPNMITTIIFHEVPTEVPGYNLNHFFLGTANDMILYLMPAFCLAILYLMLIKANARPIILMVSIIITVLFSDSFTTVISLLVFICFFVIIALLFKNKIINTHLICLIPIIGCLVICLPYFFTGKNIIIDYILENIYYNHSFEARVVMWNNAREYVYNRPITGYGYYSDAIALADNDLQIHGTAHNTIIQRTINYGLIGLVLLMFHNFLVVSKLNKIKDGLLKTIFVCFLCSIFIAYTTQDYHRYFEFQLIFTLAYNLDKINYGKQNLIKKN